MNELTDYLHDRLTTAGFEIASPRAREHRAGITIVRDANASATVAALDTAGILASARGAGVRIAVHIFNTTADIDRCVAALDALRRGDRLHAKTAG